MLLLLLHTRREQGARTSSAVMSARLSVWAKITGHRTPASQLSAAVSTGYTQHTIPRLRRKRVHRCARMYGDCLAKSASHSQLHPRLLAQTLLSVQLFIFNFRYRCSHYSVVIRGEIEVHLITLIHLDNIHVMYCEFSAFFYLSEIFEKCREYKEIYDT